jgi:L-fucose mutarotase
MLRRVDPLLTPELLFVLASMGHGDDLVVCDENFPAVSPARSTVHGTPVRLPGIGAMDTIRAIVSLLPLDTADLPVMRMEVENVPDRLPDVQREVLAELASNNGVPPSSVGALERFAFYESARRAYAVVWTGERRFYGCFILKKGVVAPMTQPTSVADAHALSR